MARKWRPQTFEDVVGQEHIVRTLKNALQANRTSHAYLFTGPRGVGKTTTARLLAKAVNCLSPVEGEPCNHCVRCEEILSGASTDVIEIDGASNGLVDDARELREKVKYAPAACRYKVMIIDEVHMMSNAAFNALLKTLEEPPAHTIFILATTESHKIPATIISRCQRFDFRRIPLKEIVERLAVMAKTEGVDAEDAALHAVARGADGSLRDAQSLLDQIISFSGNRLTAADAVTVLGLVPGEVFIELVDAIAEQDAPKALAVVDRLVNHGADLRQFMKDWVEYWRSLVIARVVPDRHEDVLNMAANQIAEAERQSKLFPLEDLTALAKLAAATDEELRRTQHPRMLLELLLVRLCAARRVVSLDALWRQLKELESRLAGLPEKPFPEAASAAPAVAAPAVPQVLALEPAVGEVAPAAVSAAAMAESAEADQAGEPALIAESLEEAAEVTPLDQVKSQWSAVMQEVGQKNRRVQALLKDAGLTAAEDGWVELTCSSPYHQTGLEKEDARKLVEAALETVLGRNTRLRLKVASNTQKESAGEPAVDLEKEFEEIARKEPLVQKALDLFGGKIVEVRPAHGGKTK